MDFFAEVENKFGAAKRKPEQYSALGLAYIGDGVYDLIVRTIVLDLGNKKVNIMHRMTSDVVKAGSQAELMRQIESELTEEEEAVYKRGRNAKSGTSAKNASIVDYRIATGFEALLGYLYLKHNMERILELVKIGFDKTNQKPM